MDLNSEGLSFHKNNSTGKIPFRELGEIKKENCVGKGSFGVVYSTLWKASNIKVAAKKITADVKLDLLANEISQIR